MPEPMTYKGVGVDYETMDPFKRMAQEAGLVTAGNLFRHNFSEVIESRGESAYLMNVGPFYLSHVEEGLGTKNLVADAMYKLTGRSYYDNVAIDTVAMIVNDMITVGALPLSVAMHLAVGVSNWFDDEDRCRDLVSGWKNACRAARCVWSCGETPTLPGVVMPNAVVLSGSAVGFVGSKKQLIIPRNIKSGDAIVLIQSSGIHANGLTLARTIATRRNSFWRKIGHMIFPRQVKSKQLPKGYLTTLSDGRSYGEALLDPTIIYVPLVEDCFKAGISIHYAVNVTGHGWRKLMRAPQPFAYVISKIPEPQPSFRFIQEHGPVDDKEAYSNFNMGAGFAIYVDERDVVKIMTIAGQLGMTSFMAGFIETSKEKKVVIRPLGLEYLGSTLGVR